MCIAIAITLHMFERITGIPFINMRYEIIFVKVTYHNYIYIRYMYNSSNKKKPLWDINGGRKLNLSLKTEWQQNGIVNDMTHISEIIFTEQRFAILWWNQHIHRKEWTNIIYI